MRFMSPLMPLETWGQQCETVIKQLKNQLIVELQASESWPFPSAQTIWYITFCRLSNRWCRVMQVSSGRLTGYKAYGKARFLKTNSSMIIMGRFKLDVPGQRGRPDFCLYLTTQVDQEEAHRGLIMSGSLERGQRKTTVWEPTHYVFVRRLES
ncbi:unnamed protein product [Dicrocoelium dendriticum]|nr:unnamed protein product [Dicrocoelium dendriticum]